MKPQSVACLLLLAGCHAGGEAARVAQHGADSVAAVTPGDSSLVIREATLVVFVLPAVDTLKEDDQKGLLEEFRFYTERVTADLSDSEIRVVSTHRASVTVWMEHGPSRVIMLSGLDYPFGYVLVDPGYPEVIMTGVTTEEELLDQAGWYFGLDDADSAPGDQQIADDGGLQVRSVGASDARFGTEDGPVAARPLGGVQGLIGRGHQGVL